MNTWGGTNSWQWRTVSNPTGTHRHTQRDPELRAKSLPKQLVTSINLLQEKKFSQEVAESRYLRNASSMPNPAATAPLEKGEEANASILSR